MVEMRATAFVSAHQRPNEFLGIYLELDTTINQNRRVQTWLWLFLVDPSTAPRDDDFYLVGAFGG